MKIHKKLPLEKLFHILRRRWYDVMWCSW